MDLIGLAALVAAFLALLDLVTSATRSRLVWAVFLLALAIVLVQLGVNVHVPARL